MLRKARLSPAISLFAALHLGTPAERAGSWLGHPCGQSHGFCEARPRPLDLVNRERLPTLLRGQNWKRDSTPLLSDNRRTRNLWTARGDVSIVRPRRSYFNAITLSATKGHTLFLNAPWTEHDCGEVRFRCNSSSVKYLYESAIDCCISKNEGHRRTGVCFAVNRRTKLIPDLEWAPWGGQRSGGGLDHRPGVAILELLGLR
jgi:hypothetical protein